MKKKGGAESQEKGKRVVVLIVAKMKKTMSYKEGEKKSQDPLNGGVTSQEMRETLMVNVEERLFAFQRVFGEKSKKG